MITVGLPVYNSNQIAWLAMEGLCNQKTNYTWELIICEEQHKNQCGKDLFESYASRLVEAGCVRIVYISLNKWVNLPTKWKMIANAADPKSECFILQSADCYSSSDRIELAQEYIINQNYDWYDEECGLFYDVILKKSILFSKMLLNSSEWKTGLNMAAKTFYLKNLPETILIRGIDSYLYRYIHHYNHYAKSFCNYRLNKLSLDVNGVNNLSIFRQQMFVNPNPPFKKTTLSIDDLDIDKNIIIKLQKTTFKQPEQSNDVEILMHVNKSNFNANQKYFVTLNKAQSLRILNQCELVISNVNVTYTPINIDDMLIKLKRPLWNNQPDSQMEVSEENANWAINKGYAEKVEKTEYSDKQEKTVIENKEVKDVPSKGKGRKPNR